MADFSRTWTVIGPELERVVRQKGGIGHVADELDVSYDTLRNWLRGISPPKLYQAMDLISILGIADMDEVVQSIVTGRGTSGSDDLLMVPVYDVQLAAGDGALNERADLIDKKPFTYSDLSRFSDHADPERLAIFQARGDSMEPTVRDRDLIMVDLADKRFRDDVFAFDLHNEARIKRFKFGFNEVTISSDNDDSSEPMVLKNEEMDSLNLIGRVIWRSGRM